ncbi:MAG: hypothetical protein QM725_14595 [Lacibacter sp.]
MNRTIIFLVFFFIVSTSSSAQNKNPFSSIRPQLERVVNDYPNQFALIKSEKNESEPGTIQYGSKIEIKNAVETKVIGFTSKTKIHWVWESKLLVTEDIDELKKLYKLYYNDIAGKSLLSKGNINSIKATGPYDAPSEELRLWTNQFRMNDVTGEFSNMVIDLVAEYIGFEWTVFLRVYDKEKDDEIKPSKDKNDKYRF